MVYLFGGRIGVLGLGPPLLDAQAEQLNRVMNMATDAKMMTTMAPVESPGESSGGTYGGVYVGAGKSGSEKILGYG